MNSALMVVKRRVRGHGLRPLSAAGSMSAILTSTTVDWPV